MSGQGEIERATAEARRRWKPFAPVADLAFDDQGEAFIAGFVEGALWASGAPAAEGRAPDG